MSRMPPSRRRPGPRPRPRRTSRVCRSPLRPADPANPGRRDTTPAGRVLLIIVSALLAAAVLNAQALLDDARGKPLGTSRTVSIAVWSPVARVAAALSLDRPRNAAEAALGRRDDAPTVTVTVPPADVARAPAVPAGPRPLRAATPEDKLQVLLVGDSTMTQVGGALTRQLAATGVAEAHLDARPATGFSRPDFFDWPTRLAELVSNDATELTIAMFGANDAQGFEYDGDVHDFGTESWQRIYRARVATAMDVLVSRGDPVVWIGQPVMRSADFDARVRLIDDIVRSEAAARPAIRYVDSRRILAGPDGGYAEYHVGDGGDRTRIRDGDGVHLTNAGADLLAAAVLEPIVAELEGGGHGGSR